VTTIERTIEIRAPRKRVWAQLTDFAQMQAWFLGVKRVQVPGGVARAGAERLLTLVWGASHRERFGHWEPEKSFSIIVLDPPRFVREWTALIRIDEVGAGTTVFWEMRWEPRFGLLGRVFDRVLLRPAIGTALRVSLGRLRRRVEAVL
jgi:uncharacterized protein YndB with AHSA1/START domain